MYTGALYSDLRSDVAEKENIEGFVDVEVNVPEVGSNMLFSIKSFSSVMHSSYVTTSVKCNNKKYETIQID